MAEGRVRENYLQRFEFEMALRGAREAAAAIETFFQYRRLE